MIIFPEKIEPKNPAILFIHGWRSDEKNYIRRGEILKEQGYICATFNLRGHGDNPGDINSLTRADFLQDCIKAYDDLAKIPEVDTDNISFVGASFGAYLAALLSKERKAQNLILRAPADYSNNGFSTVPVSQIAGENKDTHDWRMHPRTADDSYALEAVSQFTGNILLVESGTDVFIPHQTILNYKNTPKNSKQVSYVLMADQEHSLNESGQKEFTELIFSFLKK